MNLRLFRSVAAMEMRKTLAYRAEFWAGTIIGFAANLLVVYFVWQAVFRESGRDSIGGYTLREIVAYYVLVGLLGKIVRGYDFGAGGVSDEIYQGGLTRYLIYPTRFFAFKYAQQLGQQLPAIVQLLLFGAICIPLFGIAHTMDFSPATIAMTLAALAVANMLNYLIYWAIECVAFWQDNVWSLNVMAQFTISILGGAMLPLSVFPHWAQEPLHYLPFRFLYAFPANIMMGRVSAREWLLGMAVCCAWTAVCALICRAIWKRGLREYTGVGI